MSDVENETFIEKFHLSKETFNALYELVLCKFVKKSTHLRETIPGKKRHGIFLEWMAHSVSFGELAKEYRIRTLTVHGIMHQCVSTILELVPNIVKFPLSQKKIKDTILELVPNIVKFPLSQKKIKDTI